MPGIVGLVTKIPRERAEPELLRMVEALRHESFYVTGTWIDEAVGVYVGWATRKNSFSERMPVCNERGDVVLVFSGEEFSEAGATCHLGDREHAAENKSTSDLIRLYEDSSCFPASLNGRFQGLLTDRTKGKTVLFNDRYGMHRIYYHESKEAFYFAAEAKAILEVRPELRSLDPRGMGEFIACGCVLENRTLFKRVHVLPPGSAWVFRDGALDLKSTYFQPREWENQDPLEPETYYQEVRRIFSRNLPRYFNGHERIGISLTGGLDTRVIMAWRKPPPRSLPCYSFGGMFRDSQDVLLARRVARMCEQPYEVIQVGEEFLTRFPRYAERTVYLTDGCTSVDSSADLYVNEQARKIAPVRMTGNYGGEVLRRVRAFKPVEPTSGLFRPELLSHIFAAGATYADLLRGHPLSFAVFRQAPWHHYGLLSLEETQLTLRTPYLDNDFVQTVFRAPKSALASQDISLRLIADGNAALQRIRTDRGLAGNGSSLRAVIARGVLGFTYKAEYAYDYGMPQWVAGIDHFFSAFHLERLFLGKHKFYHFRVWYRDVLSKYVREMLLDPRTLSRPFLDRKRLEMIVRRHIEGARNYTSAIHQVLTLEHIHRLFLDSQ